IDKKLQKMPWSSFFKAFFGKSLYLINIHTRLIEVFYSFCRGLVGPLPLKKVYERSIRGLRERRKYLQNCIAHRKFFKSLRTLEKVKNKKCPNFLLGHFYERLIR